MSDWVEDELGGAKFPDVRLKKRLMLMVDRLSKRPEASLPQAMGIQAETKGAYRFLNSKKVTPDSIRKGHIQSCIKRIEREEIVLIIQDSSMLDFTHHPDTVGLGYMAVPRQNGLITHTALTCTTDGVPLGFLAQEVWARDPQDLGKGKQRRKRLFGEKESARWVRTMRATTSLVPEHVSTVTIADSEADIFELFAAERPVKADLLIRAAHNRRVEGEAGSQWEMVMASPVRGETSVEIKTTEKRAGRTARCSIRFQRVKIRPPLHNGANTRRKEAISLWAILVLEEDAPQGEKPLCWKLLTTLKVENLAEALQCVKWYSHRWLIERYHMVLKSGCRIERLQLETAERLERAIAVYSVVAWRLLWLTYEARRAPEASCESVLETHEWESLYCTIHKTIYPPSQPPTLRQAVRWIAQLGGFMGRKSDGEPGVMVVWRGLRRLEDIASTWLLLRPTRDVGNDKPTGKGVRRMGVHLS